MESELKRTIILEHYQNPKNRGLQNKNGYLKVNTNSKSCIDQIDLEILVEDGVVKDIRFDGEACAICTSSTSIMIDILIGKKVEDALNIINNYEKMINEEEYDEKLLEEAIVYSDISKQPNRKNCALLTWQGTKKVLDNDLKKIN